AGFSAVLERRGDAGVWLPLATLNSDGLGALRYEDRDVRPGASYDYRLHWSDGRGVDRTSPVITLEVPLVPKFAFRGAPPNPMRGELSLSFVLDDSGPATLEFYDVVGRRVATHPLALEPGDHLLPMPAADRLPPGVYSVRLRQGPHAAIQRLVVLR